MRCDFNSANALLYSACFNPHTYMRCDWVMDVHRHTDKCFNPHTYMRCDGRHRPWFEQWKVSIHTPTWGVTLTSVINRTTLSVSIHTPTWGVTIIRKADIENSQGFNPHTYMRCDPCGRLEDCPIPVSIHTPTWGVTRASLRFDMEAQVSIHTPTWGVTDYELT